MKSYFNGPNGPTQDLVWFDKPKEPENKRRNNVGRTPFIQLIPISLHCIEIVNESKTPTQDETK